MQQLEFNQSSSNNHIENSYSLKPHIIFGSIITMILLLIFLFFSNILSKILNNSPLFFYCLIGSLGTGIIFYFYKLLTIKNSFSSISKESFLQKSNLFFNSTDFFNFLQIFICIAGILTIIISIFDITESLKNSTFNHTSFINKNYSLLIEPLYIMLMILTSITTLFILSLRIKEIISEIYIVDETTSNPTKKTIPLLNNGAFMSDENINKSVTAETDDNQTPFTLANYDNGFFYKKLFELNDNILHIKRQIIVAKNDNNNEVVTNDLWDNKIHPFLTNLLERIANLEEKFSYSQNNSITNDLKNTDTATELSVLTDNLETKQANPLTADQTDIKNIPTIMPVTENLPISKSLSENPDEIDEFLIPEKLFNSSLSKKTITENSFSDNEESFDRNFEINKNNQESNPLEESFIHNDKTHEHLFKNKLNDKKDINTKEKTLDELRSFLEAKMQELYDDELSKVRS